MPYCVDTSGWLDGWQRHYPPDVFPSLWNKLDALINKGEIISSEEVYVELQRKSDELHDWVKVRKHMLVQLEEDIQMQAAMLLNEFPRLVDTLRNRSKADPFVIATAMAAFENAMHLLRKIPGQKELVRESEFDRFTEHVAEEIETHASHEMAIHDKPRKK